MLRAPDCFFVCFSVERTFLGIEMDSHVQSFGYFFFLFVVVVVVVGCWLLVVFLDRDTLLWPVQ